MIYLNLLTTIQEKRKSIVIFTLSMMAFKSSGQTASEQNQTDFHTWTSIGVIHKLNEKWDFKLEEQLRLKENSMTINQSFTDINIGHTLLQNFKLNVGSRFINENVGPKKEDKKYFRFNVDGNLTHKIYKLSLNNRLRYQNLNEFGNTNFSIRHARLETSLAYDLRKWKSMPKVSGEIFKRYINNETGQYEKYRLTFETEFKIKKTGTCAFFYRVDKGIANKKTIQILGTKFYVRI